MVPIDAPRLNGLDARRHSKAPMKHVYSFMMAARAGVVSITFLPQTAIYEGPENAISCRESDWRLSSLAQVCHRPRLCLSFTVRKLYIQSVPWSDRWKNGIEDTQWLELLRSFTAVKVLHITDKLSRPPCKSWGVGENGGSVVHFAEYQYLQDVLCSLAPVELEILVTLVFVSVSVDISSSLLYF